MVNRRALRTAPLVFALAAFQTAAAAVWEEARPLPEPRSGHTAVAGGDGRIYLLGGHPERGMWGRMAPERKAAWGIRVYDPGEERWSSGPSPGLFPSPRRYHSGGIVSSSAGRPREVSLTAYGPPLAVADLQGRVIWLNRLDVATFDPATRSWKKTVPPLWFQEMKAWEGSTPASTHEGGAAASGPDGRIYLVGGKGRRIGRRRPRTAEIPLGRTRSSARDQSTDSWEATALVGTLDIYDPASGTWSAGAALREPRHGHAAVFGWDGRLYVFGGWGRSQEKRYGTYVERALSWVEVYDPKTNTWSPAPRMPWKGALMGAAMASDGRIYLAGGSTHRRPARRDVAIFDPASLTWSRGPELRTGRRALALVAGQEGRLWAIGGTDEDCVIDLRALLSLACTNVGGHFASVEVVEVEPSVLPAKEAGRSRAEAERLRAEQLTGFLEKLGAARGREARRPARAVELLVMPADSEAAVELGKALSNPDWMVRRSAARALARMGRAAERALPALVSRLEDEHPGVRWAVVEALFAIEAETIPMIPVLVSFLESLDRNDRLRATRFLGRVGAPALPALIAALADEDHLAPHEVVWALYEIGPPAVPALLTALDGKDLEAQRTAAYALGLLGPASGAALPRVAQLIGAEDGLLHSLAFFALSQIGPPALSVLVPALDDERKEVRVNAAWALSEIGGPAAIRALRLYEQRLTAEPVLPRWELRHLQQAMGHLASKSASGH